MGCGVSRVGQGDEVHGRGTRYPDFRLPSGKLTFTQRQLVRLNRKFGEFLDSKTNSDKHRDRQAANVTVIVERLVQRLVCNVGHLDPRFSSKFLINLEPQKSYVCERRNKLKFKYLVRIDLVSSPALYPEVFKPPVRIIEGPDDESLPDGFAKIRVHGEFLKEWSGFLSSNGFLRRDKIQERFVELLARAAAKPSGPFSPTEVDESKHCGCPGKVVDPITLHHILRTPSSHQFFFGSAECNESRFPDPRDFRIAIVEGVPETRLHISFLSPTAQSITSEEDVEISIVLGIGVTGWPSGTDYPFRLPLDHVDFILGYRASQLGYYLVPKGPHSSVYCEDRCSVWEIRAFPTEMFLQHHYSPTSVIYRVYKILVYVLDVLRARGVKTVNRFILKNLFFFELENKRSMRHWAPNMISRRVLSILDRLLACLRSQNVQSYVFPEKNLLLQDGTLEDDYVSDGDILEHYLKLLWHDGNNFDRDETGDADRAKDQMENVMLAKWESVIGNMLPPASTRSTRLGVAKNSPASISYTRRQVEYVALLLREVLNLRSLQRRREMTDLTGGDRPGENGTVDGSRHGEDFVCLLQMMFEQAKQKLLRAHSYSRTVGRQQAGKLDRILLSYDISTGLLLDDVRRNNEIDFRFPDDVSIVVKVIECLYKAIDSDGRVLGPVLRPYLNQIFKGSHENCWFLQEWTNKSDLSEIKAMEAFAGLVASKRIDPLDGVINAASKRWTWAIGCLQIIRTITDETSTRIITGQRLDSKESGLRLIFTPEPGKTTRFNLIMSKSRRRLVDADEGNGADSRYATIRSYQDVLDTAISSDTGSMRTTGERKPPHIMLRDGNPFTVASMESRRQGNHRGLGSIVQALISLQKLSVLQEISQYLPDNERVRVLSDIKKLSKEVQRLAVDNYRKNSFSVRGKNRFSFKKSTEVLRQRKLVRLGSNKPAGCKSSPPPEVYRSTNEFTVDVIDIDGKSKGRRRDEDDHTTTNKTTSTLLGTCRELRRMHRPTVFDLNTLPKPGSHKNGSVNAPPKPTLNTPFYIKVSSFDPNIITESTNF